MEPGMISTRKTQVPCTSLILGITTKRRKQKGFEALEEEIARLEDRCARLDEEEAQRGEAEFKSKIRT
jgi:hypothetical protein